MIGSVRYSFCGQFQFIESTTHHCSVNFNLWTISQTKKKVRTIPITRETSKSFDQTIRVVRKYQTLVVQTIPINRYSLETMGRTNPVNRKSPKSIVSQIPITKQSLTSRTRTIPVNRQLRDSAVGATAALRRGSIV